MRHPVEVYGALFQVTGEVLAELGRTHLRATLGLTLVLHTWTRDLRFHPHVHVLATAAGFRWMGAGSSTPERTTCSR
nr:transposase [Holophaga foetida]